MKTPVLSYRTPSSAGLRGLLLASLLLLTSTAWAAPIIKTVGRAGDYRTIALALASISEPIPDRVEIRLLEDSYNETVSINKAGTAANPIIIRPAAGVTTEIAGTLLLGLAAVTLRLPAIMAPFPQAASLRYGRLLPHGQL